ncbi:hypothetical protein [Halobacillus amylolyticus]|uniref:ImmA/IrrE family metallo-endopeptidase n=1 Tax=Halobacillus amylolyticus TaxID=2932259 RepID=A0ABY4HEW1_9BACI|nr:hypothetical protein [Halobacillus amylolyticus]UOR13274.1 hypothetical protein MUO15_07245 [Halobacillus amylolyticus]
MKQLISENWNLDSLYSKHSGKIEEQLSRLHQQINQLHINLKKIENVVTLAHELGHAYHNYILHGESAFSQ